MKIKLLSVFTFTFFCIPVFSQGLRPADGAFPFNVLDMDPDSEISCRDLNWEITNESPRIIVNEDGHLSVDGRRVRIFGTNLSEFPEKNQAERNARSLADRGINCIRFHHTDADWTKCFITKTPDGKRVIDAAGLDKFDYFVFMLKKYGIYTNLNLLTGRTYTEKDGMPAGSDKISDWKNRHLIGFWNKEARNLQKNYAKTLLEHVNPYTGIALKDDPALCIVEINNEQGLIHSYFSNYFSDTPQILWNELEIMWNSWLQSKGKNYEMLKSAYNRTYPEGDKLISSNSKWNLELHQGAKAVKSGSGDSVSIDITANGKSGWHIQLNSSGLKISPDQVYTISFEAKSSKETKFDLGLMMAHDPWGNLGWNQKIELDKNWKKYSFVVTGINGDNNARLNIGNMGFLAGTKVDFRNLQMVEGGVVEPVRKSVNGVILPVFDEYNGLPEEYKKLVLNFLYDIELEYWSDMKNYIRDTLGCPALLMGSAMGNTTIGLSMLFDIIDSHAYFNHPVFPGNGWDQNNYYVQNDDLTRQDSSRTLTNLAGYRVFGKPFSVSEYDHPYPNQFNAEMYPMYAAFASYQDWDAIYSFCSDVIVENNSKNRKMSGYFDQTHNPVKTAAQPIAARIFRTGAIKPEDSCIWINLNEEKERENLHKFRGWSVGNASVWGFDPAMALGNRIGILWDCKPGSDWNGYDVENASAYISSVKNKVKMAFLGVENENASVFWEEEKGTFRALGENAFVYVGRKDSPAIKPSTDEVLNNFQFVPSGDFASVMGVRKENGKWLVFAGAWSGNKEENLREYSQKEPYSTTKNVIQRGKVSLSSKPPYMSKDAVTLSVSGKLKFLNKKYKVVSLSEEGLPSGKTKKCSEYELNESSGTLWYLLEP